MKTQSCLIAVMACLVVSGAGLADDWHGYGHVSQYQRPVNPYWQSGANGYDFRVANRPDYGSQFGYPSNDFQSFGVPNRGSQCGHGGGAWNGGYVPGNYGGPDYSHVRYRVYSPSGPLNHGNYGNSFYGNGNHGGTFYGNGYSNGFPYGNDPYRQNPYGQTGYRNYGDGFDSNGGYGNMNYGAGRISGAGQYGSWGTTR